MCRMVSRRPACSVVRCSGCCTLLSSLIFLNVPRLNISAAYLYFSLCVQNILFLYIQFISSRSYSNIKNFFRLTITASCPMDLQYFPMDSQLCYIEIESCKYRRLCIAPAQPVYICRLYVNTAELQTKHLQILKILTNKIKIQLSNVHSIHIFSMEISRYLVLDKMPRWYYNIWI